jgi:hypothetical protein
MARRADAPAPSGPAKHVAKGPDGPGAVATGATAGGHPVLPPRQQLGLGYVHWFLNESNVGITRTRSLQPFS